jgi:hypothetical protein
MPRALTRCLAFAIMLFLPLQSFAAATGGLFGHGASHVQAVASGVAARYGDVCLDHKRTSSNDTQLEQNGVAGEPDGHCAACHLGCAKCLHSEVVAPMMVSAQNRYTTFVAALHSADIPIPERVPLTLA